jgi:hypothetical protein
MRILTCCLSLSLISSQWVTSSKVRRQLRHTSSPNTVVQWPTQGHSEVTSGGDINGREQCMAQLYLWPGCQFHLREPGKRVIARIAAHFDGRLKSSTEGRALRLTEHLAAQFFIKLNAGYSGGLAVRHAGQRRSN